MFNLIVREGRDQHHWTISCMPTLLSSPRKNSPFRILRKTTMQNTYIFSMVASQIVSYSLYSALLLTRALGVVLHYIENSGAFGRHTILTTLSCVITLPMIRLKNSSGLY
jgi:hypothetical protein